MTPVRRLREQAGLTQDLLAKCSGLTQQTISRYETGVGSPTLRTLDRLAEAVGVRVIVSFAPGNPDDESVRSLSAPGGSSVTGASGGQPTNRRRDLWTI